MSTADDELTRAALERLGLAKGSTAVPAQGEPLLDAHVRAGAMARHQVLAVRAYVTRFSATCACGARRLLPESGDPGACPSCGARPPSSQSSSVSSDPLPPAPAAPPASAAPASYGNETALDPPGTPPLPLPAAGGEPEASRSGRVEPLPGSSSGSRRRNAMQRLGPGDRVGPLELLEVLGRGASGVVFRARHTELGRESAVKVLPGAAKDERRRRRFEREVEALGRLGHAAIVRVHATFEVEDALVLEMELVRGETLSSRLARQGPLPWREAAGLLAELARAVEHAHGADVLHRDLKPDNVLVRAEDGRPLLADFGLGRLSDQASSLTVQGGLLGTPVYMAPEAFEGESSPRTDVYGLGGILYTMLTNLPPFDEGTAAALHYAVTRGACRPTAAPGAPPALEAIRARAMAVSPAARYQRAADLAADLEDLLAGRATSVSSSSLGAAGGRRPLGLAAAAGLLVVAAGVVAVRARLAADPPPPPPPSRLTRVQEALEALAAPDDPFGVLPEVARQRDAALGLLLAASRPEHAAYAEVAARIDSAVEVAARTSPGRGERTLGGVRALVERARGQPPRPSDVAAAAGVARASELDLLAQHVLARGFSAGFDDPAALAAARALVPAAPTSRAAHALRGVCACASGEVRLREEALLSLATAAPGSGRPAVLLRVGRAADAVAAALAAAAGMPAASEAMRDALVELTADRELLCAQEVLLAPITPAMRVALHDGTLIDRLEPMGRRALCDGLAPIRPCGPPVLTALVEVLRDTDDDDAFAPSTLPPVERIEEGARLLLDEDPILGASALELFVRHANERLPRPDDSECALRLALLDVVLERVTRAEPTARTTDALWLMRSNHRARCDAADLLERRASLGVATERRAALLERALTCAREALAITHQATGLAARRLPADSVMVARLLLLLGRPAEVRDDALQLDLPEPDAWLAESLRRGGDPAAARAHAVACLADLGAGRGRREAALLAVRAMAEADLGDLPAARRSLAGLAQAEGRDGVPALDVFGAPWVTAHVAEAERR